MNTLTRITRRSMTATAIAAALGTPLAPQTVSATEYTFDWDGFFIMMDSTGTPLANTSLPAKGTNRYQTPISGTFTYDDVAETGTMTVNTFDFFSNPSSLPADAQSISFTNIGDGASGPGTLLLANMLFNWNGNNGIPVSVVFDAEGMLTALGNGMAVGDFVEDTCTANASDCAIPASDGTYTNATYGYLNQGAIPVATTAWNTTFAAGCSTGSCTSVNPSAQLPLVTDTYANNNDFVMALTGFDSSNTGAQSGTHDDNSDGFDTYYGIGGNPMADGPFQGNYANFELTSMELKSDGTGPSFTVPGDVTQTISERDTPANLSVDIGNVGDEPGATTVEYSTDGGTTWTADSGGVNNVTFNLTETVNEFDVEWRVYLNADPNAVTLATQSVTITITDNTDPTFTSLPADVNVNVDSTADSVTFEGPGSGLGSVAADDNTDPSPTIEWSLDELNWNQDTAGTQESSSDFGAGDNTVYWRVTDSAGNITTYQQTVTLNVPTGIVGQPCVVDSDIFTANVLRQLEGTFTMRDSNNNLVGNIDNGITGNINGSVNCDTVACTDSGATLEAGQPFFGSLWFTSGIRLFDQPGTYTFETCLNDGSTNCTQPTPLSMTVGQNQLGAHMLFEWSVNSAIDVVLVWDFGCAGAELVSTDPDGDGVIGTQMADGPFKGMNAAFDLSTGAGENAITTGGFTITQPAYKNPVDNASPLLLGAGTIGTQLGGVSFSRSDLFDTYGADTDSGVERSCVGGCFDFSVSGLNAGDTIQVALPLSSPIPWYSLFRKYDADSDTWSTFVNDGTDSVKTAMLNDDGTCPEPGSGDYTSYDNNVLDNMLRPDDQCVQVTITDNGPNDDDPADGVIADPAGVGVTDGPSEPNAVTSGESIGGGCTLNASGSQRPYDWGILGLLLAGLGIARHRRRS